MKKITELLFMFIQVFSGCSSGTSDENVFIYPAKEVEPMSILSFFIRRCFSVFC